MIIQNTTNAATMTVQDPSGRAAEGTRSSTATATTQPTQEPSRLQLEKAVQSLNNSLQSASRDLRFSVDDKTDRVVVKVVDQTTGETVRQFPPKEALAIAASIEQFQEGLKKGLILQQEA